VFTVIFTQAAKTELIEAQDWYEGGSGGLGWGAVSGRRSTSWPDA